MKLRIKGNTLRLRLTEREVQQFETKGIVDETIKFGNSELHQLKYIIKQSSNSEIKAYYNHNRMLVEIPNELAEKWTRTNQISLEYKMSINEEETLLILVEKDFQCLKTRKHEDEKELFTNPNQGLKKC